MDFNSLLKLMVHKKGSDLFITAGMPPSMKVNGRIKAVSQSTLTPEQAREVVLSVMTADQRREFDQNHECNFAIKFASHRTLHPGLTPRLSGGPQ